MDKKDIQERIRYSSISNAREQGIISKEEAEFLLGEYVKEFDSKVHSGSAKRLLFATQSKEKSH
jgi:hypothetical protein